MQWKEILVIIIWIGLPLGALLTPNDTLMAVPFLFPYHLHNNCSQLYPADGAVEYRFFFTAQVFNVPTSVDPYSVHFSNRDDDGICTDHPQTTYEYTLEDYSMDWVFKTGNDLCNDDNTLCYQCKNNVVGLLIKFTDNPTLSMIAHLIGPYFDQSLAIYPLLSDRDQKQTGIINEGTNRTYQYQVLFGIPRYGILDGIVIHIIYESTDVTIHSSDGVVVLKSGKEHKFYKQSETIELKKECQSTIIWIEPNETICSNQTTIRPNDNGAPLQWTVIESSKPIVAFTNHAYCSKSGGFSFKSQLVHQMPTTSKWGKRFILDVQQARILPTSMTGTLLYYISIKFSQTNTTVKVTYYSKTTSSDDEPILYKAEQYSSNKQNKPAVYIQKTQSFIETLTHIDISASDPILVLYNIHSPLTNGDVENREQIYYSLIVQPVSWFSNVQTIALSGTNCSQRNFSYHVSVVIPKAKYNPEDIVVSTETSLDKGIPLTNYVGFNGNTFISGDFVVLYLSPNQYSKRDRDYLHIIIWHKDPTVDIGATVLAYSKGQHYAYSNGYTLENSPRDWLRLQSPLSSVNFKIVVIIILAVLLVVVSLLLFGVCYCRKRETRSNVCIRDDEQLLICQEPDTDYEYDLFILFSDEDEQLVQTLIYRPLQKRSYKILWKYDTTHNLFQPGADIVSDLARAIQMSRKILVVCTKYFCERQKFHRHVTFFKDVEKSERKRRLIPLVLEEEYNSDCFKDCNQIRVKQRHQLVLDPTLATEVLQKLLKSLGKPVKPSTMESLL